MCEDSARIRTARELAAAGLTRRGIAALIAAGSIERLRINVHADVGTCRNAREAALHGGRLACVSAARHFGLWTLSGPDEVHVGLGGHGRARPHPGCDCVEHWDEPVVDDGFGLPSLPRALLQVLRCRGVEEFFVCLESAMHLGAIDAAARSWLIARVGPTGREAIAFARSDAESGLESLLRWRLRAVGVRVRTQVEIPSVGRVDALLGDRLIVEVDGEGNHGGSANRHRDLVRDANAAAWGFVTLRFDYAMVVHDWPTVEAAILAHLDRGLHLVR